jgi:hypothetical protein
MTPSAARDHFHPLACVLCCATCLLLMTCLHKLLRLAIEFCTTIIVNAAAQSAKKCFLSMHQVVIYYLYEIEGQVGCDVRVANF